MDPADVSVELEHAWSHSANKTEMSAKRKQDEPIPDISDSQPKRPKLISMTSDKKQPVAVLEELKGRIEFRIVDNDKSDVAMILLTGLKNLFMKQLPNMPREYIARLVYDMYTHLHRKHQSMAVVRYPLQVVGGMTYRVFPGRDFAEIVFCAISSTEQVQGFGARLMSHVKDHVRSVHNVRHFLTYADNYAIGYFKKQGFTVDITLEKSKWMGYIKDYEGGTLMMVHVIDTVQDGRSCKVP